MIKTYCLFFLACVFLVLSSVSCQAQGRRTMAFDHLTVEEGLSQSTVYAITMDTDGFMWFGTRDGLNRYDSRNIKVYKNKPSDALSLSGNNVLCFYQDATDRLWIGTSEGVSIYNPEQDDFIVSRNDPANTLSISNNYVSAIAEDKNGVIWIATHGGLNRVTSTSPMQFETFVHHDDDPESLIHNEVRTIFVDSDGEIWLGTTIGISRLKRDAEGKIKFDNYHVLAEGVNGKSWINCLAEDDFGNILIGTEQEGIKVLDRKSGRVSAANLSGPANKPIENVRVIERIGSELWIGGLEGLYIYNSSLRTIITYRNDPNNNLSLSDNSIRSIFRDSHGTIWVGTFYGGVNQYSPMSRQFGELTITNNKNQKAYKIASAMVTDKYHNLWVSTDGNGLYCLNQKGEIIHQFKHDARRQGSLSHNKIKCLLPEEDGLWIGTINGLNFYNFKTGKFDQYFHNPDDPSSIGDDRIYDITKDSRGRLWVATYRGGLCLFNKGNKTFKRFVSKPGDLHSLSTNGITTIHEDAEKNLWIGTVSGLHKMPAGKISFEQYGNHTLGNPEGGGDYILCIYEDTHRNLWIGTRDTGLKLKTKNSDKLKTFTMRDGLPGNNINGILEDGHGYLWMSTESGLSRMDPETLKFKNYNRNDGLVCTEFNFNSFYVDDDDFMYFGGYNGIVKFHPDSIRENNEPPVLRLTKFKIFNREVPIDGAGGGVLNKSLEHTPAIALNYLQNVFSVEFAALSFINANKNQYAYKLEGFENDWNYVSDPVATYMNLSPGDYTLLVKASNNDGIWMSAPVGLDLTVLPPPWKTWWAYSIYCLVILGLLFALIRFNKMRWKLAHDLKIEHLEKEQQEQLHRAKLNFFTNIAHEIRTPLTLIVSPIELLTERYSGNAFLQRQLKMVSSNTGRLMRLINQLLDFQKQEAGNLQLRPVEGNLVELLKEIVFSFTEHANARHIRLLFRTAHNKLSVRYDRDELEKVFCNLLHNAFKFTPGGGEISVSMDMLARAHEGKEENFVRIRVEDNGIGIPAEDLPKIFNRFYQVENTKINESGFGIGLALTKGIINLHGGTIEVDSHEAELGQSGYTRFTILLPILPDELPVVNTVEVPSTLEKLLSIDEKDGHEKYDECDQASDNRPTVQLVEDNAEIRSCLKTILSHHYRIAESSNGKEAWEFACRHLPDLIISDIAMPEMDGLELTRRIKQDERTSHIPVFLLTARGAMEHHIEGIETEADDYITKPFHAQILQLKIRNLLALRERLKEKYHRVVTLEPQQEELEDPSNRFLKRLLTILEANLNDPDFNVAKLVTEIGMSRPVLFRKVKVLTGLSVIDLIRSTRLKKAEMLLRQRKMTISEVAFTVGFNDPKYFSKSFRIQFGRTPSEYIDSLEEKSSD
jgi:signal transduction histidine kinase/ligand-binding sensor domain-containing protein/CheY-like chemotaxis protein/AraC-like DNA-binding protein